MRTFFLKVLVSMAIISVGAFAAPNVYVDAAADFTPANPAVGDTVTWNGTGGAVSGLVFGTNAFSTVQAGIDAVDEGGTVRIAAGEYDKGSSIIIGKTLALLGDGAGLTALLRDDTDGEASTNQYSVVTVSGTGTVATIDGLSISGGRGTIGRPNIPFGGRSGGGINVQLASVIVSNCSISGNTATERHSGGGIGGDSPTITVRNSTLTDNTAATFNSGGGIGGYFLFGGSITVSDSTVSGNTALDGNSGGGIGGLEPTITVNNSTVGGNTARANLSGGGIGGFEATIAVINSTVSGNTAGGIDCGGGIGGVRQAITVTGSTVSGNTAGGVRSGGGIGGQDVMITVGNALVVGNTGSDTANNELISTATNTDNGGNLLAIPAGLSISNIIAPLSDNGGTTQTHALVAGSPAIDAGVNALATDGGVALATDQRGAGFPRILVGTVDIGAFELPNQAPAIVFSGGVDAVPTWVQSGNDIDGSAPQDLAGANVAISKDNRMIAVGFGFATVDGVQGAGKVVAYQLVSGRWEQRGNDMNGIVGFERFGLSVSISEDGDTILANGRGGARVYDWDEDSNLWVQRGLTQMAGPIFTNYIGSADMSRDTDTIFLGSGITGRARAFLWDGNSWVQRGGDLSEPEPAGIGTFFGVSVAISANGNTIAAGAAGSNANGANSGAIFVYDWDVTAGDWRRRGTAIAGRQSDEGFGRAVSLSDDGNSIFGVASGQDSSDLVKVGYAQVSDWDGSAWIQRGEPINGEEGDSGVNGGPLGDLSADGNRLVFGTSGVDGDGFQNGRMRSYRWSGTAWLQVGQDIENEITQSRDTLFSSITVELGKDGRSMIVGAPENDGNGDDAGNARVFLLDDAQKYSVAENETFLTDAGATDDRDSENGGGLTYSLTGGEDMGLFSVDTDTGEVSFVEAPDFEAPADAGADNVYNIRLTVTDSGSLTDTRDIQITVTDAAEFLTLVSSSPANGSSGIARDTEITLTFDSDVVAGTGNILIVDGDGRTVATIPIADATITGNTVSFTPTMALPANTGFLIVIPDGVIIGTNGNQYSLAVGTLGFTSAASTADIYVDAAEDFTPANPANGDTVTWNGTGGAVSGLVFGANAFSTVQAGVDAVDEGGTVFVAAGEYFEGSRIEVGKSMTLSGDGAGLTALLRAANENGFSIIRVSGEATVATVENFRISGGVTGSTGTGGGIDCQDAEIIVNFCEISGNTVSEFGSGGGIGGTRAKITVNNSTVSGNTSLGAASGGGIGGSEPIIIVTNSTISGNAAREPDSGGGIGGDQPNITLINSTLSDNEGTDSGSAGGIGGVDPIVSVSNSLVIGNLGRRAESNEILSDEIQLTDNGGNLLAIPAGLSVSDIIAPLADNGGPTLTHAIVARSPAIDAGLDENIAAGVTMDQRGAGFPRINGVAVDIGAVEFPQNSAPVLSAGSAFSVAENTTAVNDFDATDDRDVEGSGLSYSLTGLDAALLEISQLGELSFISAPDFETPADAGGDNVYNVTVTVTDSASLSDGRAVAITVTDVVENLPPTITLNGMNPTTVECAIGNFAETATASDPEDGDITGSLVIGGEPVDINALGSYVLTYDVTDSGGLSAPQLTRTVNVVDTTAPVIALIGGAVIAQEAGTPFSDPGTVLTEACDTSLMVVTSGDTVNVNVPGVYTINYDATDSSGNVATRRTRTVTVADTTAPVITLIGSPSINLSVNTDTYNEQGATATDSFDGAVAVTIGGDTVDTSTVGTYTVTYNAEDAAGNNAVQVTRTVTVSDAGVPVITLVGSNPQFIELPGDYVELGATAQDAVDGDISGSIVIDATAVDTTTPGTYGVSYNVSDTAGNAAVQVIRTVTVQDTTAPVITLNGSPSINLSVNTDTYNEQGATATDSFDGAVAVTIGGDTVDTSMVGTYTVTYDAQDAAGNNAVQVTRTVAVRDTGVPVITLVGANPQFIECPGDYVELGARALDEVEGDISASIVIDATTVDTTTPGTYGVSYNVSDSSGNAAVQVIRTVIVQDTTAPVITLTGEPSLTVPFGSTYADEGATVTDACDETVTVTTVNPVDTNTAGTYIVRYNATDVSGNQAPEVTRSVTVASGAEPELTVVARPALNRQSGLLASPLSVTNTGRGEAVGFRIYVSNLPDDVTLYNASGTDATGRPYLLYNQSLAPGATVTLTAEYFRPSLDPNFNPVYTIEILDSVEGTPDAAESGIETLRTIVLANGDVLIEISSVPGAIYAVEYSPDMTPGGWIRVQPTITAVATSLQWIDNGAPKTASHPSTAASRFYRFALIQPAPTAD